MKRALLLVFIYGMTCSFAPTRNFFIQKIRIGKFHYNIYREKDYSHDDGLDAEYFVVYNTNKKLVASGYLSAKRNDTEYIKGSYSFSRKRFVEKVYYSYPPRYGIFANSSISIFYPDANGDLILKNHKDFYKGKVTVYRY